MLPWFHVHVYARAGADVGAPAVCAGGNARGQDSSAPGNRG